MPIVNWGTKDEPSVDEPSSIRIDVCAPSGRSIPQSSSPVATPIADELADEMVVGSNPEANADIYRTPTRRNDRSMAALIAFGACAFLFALYVPDIDQLFLAILHHRSILTHSVLPGLLLWWFARHLSIGPAASAGAMVGLAVHLAADALAPSMVGFAMVWTPWPVKTPLGGWSYPWLLGNSLLASFLSFRILQSEQASLRSRAVLPAGGGIISSGLYGWLNEGSIIAVVAGSSSVVIGLWAYWRWHVDARPGPPGHRKAR